MKLKITSNVVTVISLTVQYGLAIYFEDFITGMIFREMLLSVGGKIDRLKPQKESYIIPFNIAEIYCLKISAEYFVQELGNKPMSTHIVNHFLNPLNNLPHEKFPAYLNRPGVNCKLQNAPVGA